MSERKRGVVPLEQARAMSGLELLQGWCAGRLPSPPIGAFLNGDLVQVSEGLAVFEATPIREHLNPLGSVHGGFSATLLDSCMGCAVHSMLPAGQGYTTLELKVNLIRGLMPDTGPIRATGRVLNVGKRVGVAEGHLRDGAGRLIAHGSTTCLIFAL